VERPLIEKLVAEVGIQNIKTQTKVTAIKKVDNHLEVTGSDGSYKAATVISTLLRINSNYNIEPHLPDSMQQLARKRILGWAIYQICSGICKPILARK
jgi:monoamine oxidase